MVEWIGALASPYVFPLNYLPSDCATRGRGRRFAFLSMEAATQSNPPQEWPPVSWLKQWYAQQDSNLRPSA